MGTEREISTERISSQSLLSRQAILKHMENGSIVIDPFRAEQLETTSYDVRLGEYFFANRPQVTSHFLYNPWDEQAVRSYWGEARKAQTAFEVFGDFLPKNIRPNDQVIVFSPGELLLGHTEEFIGGRVIATSMMKARSSIGRSGFTVCKCAGWGDVGYINRWTMEIKNDLPCQNFLIVGEPVAQITLFEVDPIHGDYAKEGGKYQTKTSLEELKESWIPDLMLPKLWMDRSGK